MELNAIETRDYEKIDRPIKYYQKQKQEETLHQKQHLQQYQKQKKQHSRSVNYYENKQAYKIQQPVQNTLGMP